MFWKLCKHELKCSYRGFLILYAITLLLAVMINPSIDSKLWIAAMCYPNHVDVCHH